MGIYLGDNIIANFYKLPDQTGNAGKALVTNGVTASWQDASSVYEYTQSGTYAKKSLVFIDNLNASIPSPSPYSDAIWLYSTPVYPYVPMTNQVSGTSYTFTNGGMVICTSPTNLTVGVGEASPLVFSNFVGIMPVSMGLTVSTSQTSYFAGY